MRIFSSVFVIIGIIIGAGFASGKEIYSFFLQYGKLGIIGMFLSILLIGYIIYKTLKVIKEYNIDSYNDLLEIILGNFKYDNSNIKTILNFIINVFLLISFFVMCAGFVAYFRQELGINQFLSCIIVAIFCYLILNNNINGVVLLNSILMPIIIVVLGILGIKAFNINEIEILDNTNNDFWLIKSILYASYNSITLVSILLPIKNYIKCKKDILKIASISVIIIGILASIISILLLTINGDIDKIELPSVYAAGNFGIIYKYLYGAIILGAIITTAISSAYGFLNNVSKSRIEYKKYNKIICFLSVFVSLIGFSNLVNNLYPIFGFLGLLQLILIIKCK